MAQGAAEVWTVARILQWTTTHLQQKGSETPRLDAEILLAFARRCTRMQLYTNYENELDDATRTTMRDLVKRRAAGEPVAYLVGHREFFSLDFLVSSAVLIPRPDTETLVVELLESLKGLSEPRVLEIGTGSGCIAIATAVRTPTASVVAVDISPDALAIATQNAAKHKCETRIDFRQGDLFAAVREGETFHAIASNPPYVPQVDWETLDPGCKYEPRIALDGGPDGMEILRRIVDQTSSFLEPGGRLLLELDPPQAEVIAALLTDAGLWEDVRIIKDIEQRARVVSARKLGQPG